MGVQDNFDNATTETSSFAEYLAKLKKRLKPLLVGTLYEDTMDFDSPDPEPFLIDADLIVERVKNNPPPKLRSVLMISENKEKELRDMNARDLHKFLCECEPLFQLSWYTKTREVEELRALRDLLRLALGIEG